MFRLFFFFFFPLFFCYFRFSFFPFFILFFDLRVWVARRNNTTFATTDLLQRSSRRSRRARRRRSGRVCSSAKRPIRWSRWSVMGGARKPVVRGSHRWRGDCKTRIRSSEQLKICGPHNKLKKKKFNPRQILIYIIHPTHTFMKFSLIFVFIILYLQGAQDLAKELTYIIIKWY